MFLPTRVFYSALVEAEYYEEMLVQRINRAGFQAYRPDQHNLEKRLPEDPLIYTKQQHDVLIKVDKVKRLVIECKARYGSPFNKYSTILINNKFGIDTKEFPVHYYVIIDIDIKKAFVTSGSDEARKEWIVKDYSKDRSYAVPKKNFVSIDDWVDELHSIISPEFKS